MSRHVFISYSRVDRDYVEGLVDHLRTAGIPTWFDYRLVAGEQFDEAIQHKIDEAGAFVVILTPAAYESRWVAREIAYAETRRKQIVPLLLEHSPVFFRLVDIHREDVTGGRLPGAELMKRLRLLCDVASESDIPADHCLRAKELPNPWQTPDIRRRIGGAEDIFGQRVLGQTRAIDKIVDVLKRAALGLSGAQRGVVNDRRPRAVFLFAGPIGTGRLEAAACIADVVFGDLSAYIRFSMGEFSSESQVDRLVGAPPGFAGSEPGGALTNALHEHPYRVVVFDEIEKAHPRFYDKFLQIMEDGRLTDDNGITVDFSRSIIVAVTSLGSSYYSSLAGVPAVSPDMPYPELEASVRSRIHEYFAHEVARPEILNRLGDNIIVFDSLSPDVLRAVFDHQLSNICRRLIDHHDIDLAFTTKVATKLWETCAGSTVSSGREVGNRIESYLLNPLARYLFDNDCVPGSRLTVTDILLNPDDVAELAITVESSDDA